MKAAEGSELALEEIWVRMEVMVVMEVSVALRWIETGVEKVVCLAPLWLVGEEVVAEGFELALEEIWVGMEVMVVMEVSVALRWIETGVEKVVY